MSFNVEFFRVAKRKNSTFVPETKDVVRTEMCTIKEGTGVLNPVITIANSSASFNPSKWNYCHISSFSRYYWMSDWKNEDNLWTAQLKVDVLASYRETIKDYNYYVVRSSTSFDGGIADALYPKKPQVNRQTVTGNPLWQIEQGFDVAGSYVVGIVNKQGLCNYYAMNPANFKNLANAIFSNIKWMIGDGISGVSDNLIQIAVNPAQYITSVTWFPFTLGGTQMSGISIGWWDVTGLTLYKLDDDLWKTKETSVTPTSHPQLERGNYLNCQPYRYIRVYIPPFGCLTVDSGKIRDGESIKISADVDPRTGHALCRVSVDNTGGGNELLGIMYSNIGVSISTSDIKTNYSNVASGVSNALGSLFKLDIGGFAKGVADSAMAVGSAEVSTKGGQGSTIGLTSYVYCYIDCMLLVDEDRADNGRPYCKNGKFSTLGTGYYEVENGSTPLSGAYQSEIDEVKNFLESGVYYA